MTLHHCSWFFLLGALTLMSACEGTTRSSTYDMQTARDANLAEEFDAEVVRVDDDGMDLEEIEQKDLTILDASLDLSSDAAVEDARDLGHDDAHMSDAHMPDVPQDMPVDVGQDTLSAMPRPGAWIDGGDRHAAWAWR